MRPLRLPPSVLLPISHRQLHLLDHVGTHITLDFTRNLTQPANVRALAQAAPPARPDRSTPDADRPLPSPLLSNPTSARPLPSLDTELESFRQQWRTEVAFARAGGSRSTAGVAGIPVSASTSSSYPLGTIPQPTSLQRRQKSPPTSPRAAPTTSRRRLSAVSRSPERKLHDYLPTSIGSPSSSPRSTTSSLLSPPQQPHVALPPLPAGVDPTNEPPQSALAVYQQAIDAEHASQLNEAIRLYQRAFRLNDQVDKDYAHFVAQSTDQAYETPPLDDGQGSTDEGQKDEDDLVFRFQRQYHLGPDYSPTPTPHASSTNLHSSLIYGGAAVRSSIINSSDPVVFDQADETEPCFLQGVPDEVLVVVLAKLGEGGDVCGIGRFAQTCKKAFLLSLEQGVWKCVFLHFFSLVPSPLVHATDSKRPRPTDTSVCWPTNPLTPSLAQPPSLPSWRNTKPHPSGRSSSPTRASGSTASSSASSTTSESERPKRSGTIRSTWSLTTG